MAKYSEKVKRIFILLSFKAKIILKKTVTELGT
jgi:hypothetical protein